MHKQIVVIDQVTDILVDHSAFASSLQQAWDQALQHRRVLLILIGDHYGRVYEHLRSYSRAPLYGRFTAVWHASPVPWADFSTAFRWWPLHDQLLAYAVTGGWPAFVKAIEPDQAPRQALRQLIASSEYRNSISALVEQFDPTRRMAIMKTMRALAQGAASQPELVQRSRLSRQTLNSALVDLEIATLVETNDIPIEGQLPLSQRAVFRLSDHQIRFFFRFFETTSKSPSLQEPSTPLKWRPAEIGRFLVKLVTDRLLLPWLAWVGPHKEPIGLMDRIGPIPGMAACDAALAVVDRHQRQVLICGVVSQTRPVGERRAQAFTRAAMSLISTSWPGYTSGSLLVSLSGFTTRVRPSASRGSHLNLDVTEIVSDVTLSTTLRVAATGRFQKNDR